MTIYYYTNTSPGAPTLTGAAGSLITLLDWLLVTNLGWTKEFSGTNLASYRAATGNRFYLGVDDTTKLYSRVRGFETMTAAGVAVASGTGPFPTAAQASNGQYVRKADVAGAARQWRFISNGRMFYLSSNLVDPSNANTEYNLTMFGDIESFKSADVFNTVLSANRESTGNTGCMASSYLSTAFSYPAYLARSYTQAGGSTSGTRLAVNPYGVYGSTEIGSNASIAYPSPVLGGLHMDKVYVADGIYPSTTHIRGVYPGMYFPLHARPLENESTFHGNGEFSGRTFVVWNVGSGGQIFIENTGGWGE